jgi:hypothetical protein
MQNATARSAMADVQKKNVISWLEDYQARSSESLEEIEKRCWSG